ncbi:MAG TPA: type VI secretion system accessory protein TagJ [Rhodopila sp.]|uniref:type VI secretion system accessory protein TagJ n=1 Tax=Rhodopila sp. TaxID=2480087 RepID=UPI002C338BA4|nr:type VI secretion system accessory protein TagJ [Rhodopila sp.]HVY16865.1 type VI secretion system accessory protein TagJ [Rhodopila sp.]
MPDAREALRSGDVEGAMAALKQDVRKSPRDPKLRTFLFQMFCVTGEWDRALTQLSVAAELDPLAYPMSQAYQAAIRCEILREKVFRGERSPTVLGDPGEWLPLLMEATRLLAAGQPADAARLRDAAFDAAPATAGALNDNAFEWIADSDPRLGPVLEVFLNGNYMWVPYFRIKAIHVDAPADLRDQVWMPARFTWTNEGEAVGFVPTRYPGTLETKNPAAILSKATDWVDLAPDWSVPVGQRVLVTDAEETALMDVRTLLLTAPEDGAA